MRRNPVLNVVRQAALCLVAAYALLIAYGVCITVDRARETSSQATCSANLKQLARCALMYASDYDQHCPPAAAATGSRTWRDCLRPYLMNPEWTLHCPGADQRPQRTALLERSLQLPPRPRAGLNYGANSVHAAAGAPFAPFGDDARLPLSNDQLGQDLSNLSAPSALVLYTELLGPATAFVWPDNRHGVYRPEEQVDWRHHGGANVAYADGHVKWTPPNRLLCTDTECVWGDPGLPVENHP